MRSLPVCVSFLRKLKDSIDPSVIIIDPTSLLNTEIDNIKLEFQKVIDKLIDKTKEVPITDPQALNGKTWFYAFLVIQAIVIQEAVVHQGMNGIANSEVSLCTERNPIN